MQFGSRHSPSIRFAERRRDAESVKTVTSNSATVKRGQGARVTVPCGPNAMSWDHFQVKVMSSNSGEEFASLEVMVTEYWRYWP